VTGDRLIALCFDGTVDILDARSGRDGRIIASHKVGGVPGAVIYGITRELALVPFARVGLPSVIVWSGEFNNRVIDAIPTTSGARTRTVDPRTGKVHSPAAECSFAGAKGQLIAIKKENLRDIGIRSMGMYTSVSSAS
jgi:hypothetical protein